MIRYAHNPRSAHPPPKTVRVWDLAKSEVIHVMREHSHYIECLAFSPASLNTYETPDVRTPFPSDSPPWQGKTYKGKAGSGGFLASGSRDKTIKIWETATGICITTLIGHDNWV